MLVSLESLVMQGSRARHAGKKYIHRGTYRARPHQNLLSDASNTTQSADFQVSLCHVCRATSGDSHPLAFDVRIPPLDITSLMELSLPEHWP